MISLLENSEIVKKVITGRLGYSSIELVDKREKGGDETHLYYMP